MTPERYNLIEYGEERLSQEEMSKGWHFCYEWDFMLIGPGMWEYDFGCPHRNQFVNEERK